MSELETMSHAAFVALLRDTDPTETWPGHMMDEAADRIEALEAERDRLREALARTEGYILRRNYTMALEAIRAALSPTPER